MPSEILGEGSTHDRDVQSVGNTKEGAPESASGASQTGNTQQGLEE